MMKIIIKLTLLCFITVFVLGNYTYVLGEGKPRIAVMNLNAEGVSIVVANAVSEFLRNDLIDMGKFNVIERAGMEQILAEQRFQLSGCTSQECAVKVGKILNVRKMVVGSVIKLDKYYINVRIVDIETSEIDNSVRKSCEGQEGLEKKSRLIAEILSGKKIKKEKSEVLKKASGTELYSPIRTNYKDWYESSMESKKQLAGSLFSFIAGVGIALASPTIFSTERYQKLGVGTGLSVSLTGIIFIISGYRKKKTLEEIGKKNGWTLTRNRNNELMLAYNVYWR